MIAKEVLELEYLQNGKSMSEIATDLDVSVNKVSWWIKKYEIAVRPRSEANYLKYNKKGNPFKIKQIKNIEDGFLLGLGLGLFWGEGNKVNKQSVRLGNTDPDLIVTFVRFLKEICGVHDAKIRFGLQTFNDIDSNMAIEFWMSRLDCTRDSFMPTIVVSPPQGKGSYRKKSKYGVVTIYVNNIKLNHWMSEQIDSLKLPR